MSDTIRIIGLCVFLLFGFFCGAISFSVANDNNDKRPLIYTIVIYVILLITSFRYGMNFPKWNKFCSLKVIIFVTVLAITIISYIVYWSFIIAFLIEFHDNLINDDIYFMLICSIITGVCDMILIMSIICNKNGDVDNNAEDSCEFDPFKYNPYE